MPWTETEATSRHSQGKVIILQLTYCVPSENYSKHNKCRCSSAQEALDNVTQNHHTSFVFASSEQGVGSGTGDRAYLFMHINAWCHSWPLDLCWHIICRHSAGLYWSTCSNHYLRDFCCVLHCKTDTLSISKSIPPYKFRNTNTPKGLFV